MNRVVLENIDEKIWHIEQHVADIISAGLKYDTVYISLNREGPDARCLNLISILNHICSLFNWPRDKFVIETENLIESTVEFEIRKQHKNIKRMLSDAQSIEYNVDKNFDKHFGLLIGRSNWNRLWLATTFNQLYTDKTLLTFHYDPASDFHKEHLGIEKLYTKSTNRKLLIDATQFIAQCPVTLDELDVITSYPIKGAGDWESLKIYHRFFAEVVCESFTAGTTFFPTEKTWRAIKSRTPFIVMGPECYLKNLQRIGFKTFDQWWDESYDNTSWALRVMEIENICFHLANKSIKELQTMYKEMKPVLDHNRHLLDTLTIEDMRRKLDV
jgi:hypothetical protein